MNQNQLYQIKPGATATCDTNMDIVNIDENMAVPHPSKHPTTTATTIQNSNNHYQPQPQDGSRAFFNQYYRSNYDVPRHQQPNISCCPQHHLQTSPTQNVGPIQFQDNQAVNATYIVQKSQAQHLQSSDPGFLQYQRQQQQQPQQPQPQQQPPQQQPPQQHQHPHIPSAHLQNNQARAQISERDEIKEELVSLMENIRRNDESLKRCCDKTGEFVIQYLNRTRLAGQVNQMETGQLPQDPIRLDKTRKDLESMEKYVKELARGLNIQRFDLQEKLHEIFRKMSLIQDKVLNEHLLRWHYEQQIASNGTEPKTRTKLEQIQTWVEMLVEVVIALRNQAKQLHHSLTDHKKNLRFDTEVLDQFRQQINRSLETLVLKSFVVEKQPPQVMKTNTRFQSTVRFLTGGKLSGMMPPNVRVMILSENNAKTVIRRRKELIQASWAHLDCLPGARQPLGLMQDTSQLGSAYPNAVATPQLRSEDLSQQTGFGAGDCDSATALVQAQSIQAHEHQAQLHRQYFQQQDPPQQQQQHPLFNVQPQHLPAAAGSQAAYVNQFAAHTSIQPPLDTAAMLRGAPGKAAADSNYHGILNLDDFEKSGEILNNSNMMTCLDGTRTMVCNFRNMQLKKIKRTEKKGTESVMDEKFVLLFYFDYRIVDDMSYRTDTINCGDLFCHMMAFSLPVVVIVHGNQEPHAWATVTWHNAFAQPDDMLYRVPDAVAWKQLGKVLSDKFKSCAGKGLSSQNLDYLGSKVCRTTATSTNATGTNNTSDNMVVSWSQFAKEPLPEKSFTFWEWFHSIRKLTQEHLRDLWNDNKIYGFIGKAGCIDLLLGNNGNEPQPVGTFLLRFSETELGGITIAYVASGCQAEQNGSIQSMSRRSSPANSSSNVLLHVLPFGGKDLTWRKLPDRLCDLKELSYLFPGMPKDDAFSDYYTPMNPPNSEGYLRPMLVQTLVNNYPIRSTMCGSGSSPTGGSVSAPTPSSMIQSSPDNVYQESSYSHDMEFQYDTANGYHPSTIQ